MFVEKLERVIFYLLVLFLPTQFGKHFWPDFSIVSGIRVDYLSPIIYVTDILVGILFATWLVRKVQGSKLNVKNFKASFKVSLFLLVFLLLNVLLSQNIWNGWYYLFKFLEFSFFAFYVSSKVTNIITLKKIFLMLGVGVLGESILAFVQFLNQGSVGGVLYFLGERSFTGATPGIANTSINGELILRAYGTFSHPNVLAGYLLVSMICLLFSLPWVQRGVEKVFWMSILLIGTCALILTMSRVAIVLWIFILMLTLIVMASRERIQAKALIGTKNVLLVIVTVLGAMIILLSPLGARFLQTNSGEEAVVQRVELIRASSEMFGQQPLIGVGLGNFIPVLTTVQKPLSFGLYLQPVHNIFLLLLAESGLIGFGFFMWFVGKTYQRLFRLAKTAQALPYRVFVVLLTVILLLGSFDHYFLTLQQGQLLLSLVLGLCWTTLKD